MPPEGSAIAATTAASTTSDSGTCQSFPPSSKPSSPIPTLKRSRSPSLSASTMDSDLPPAPQIDGEAMLEIFVHSSIRFTGIPLNSDSPYGDGKRLSILGCKALEAAYTHILFDKRPMMPADALDSDVKRLPELIEKWVEGYKWREKVRHAKEVDLRTPEETRYLMDAFITCNNIPWLLPNLPCQLLRFHPTLLLPRSLSLHFSRCSTRWRSSAAWKYSTLPNSPVLPMLGDGPSRVSSTGLRGGWALGRVNSSPRKRQLARRTMRWVGLLASDVGHATKSLRDYCLPMQFYAISSRLVLSRLGFTEWLSACSRLELFNRQGSSIENAGNNFVEPNRGCANLDLPLPVQLSGFTTYVSADVGAC